MAVYNGVAALVAFLLPVVARKTSRVGHPCVCLIIGGLGLISMSFFKDPNLLLVIHDRYGHCLGQPADHALCDS